VRLETSTADEICVTHIERKGAHVTILFSHGNAEDLNTSFLWMKRLSRDLKVNVVSYDYPGYGEVQGVPTEEKCYAAIDAVFDYLVEEKGLSPHQICLYGRSLGSGPSCYLAERTCSKDNLPVAGLILHSPFSSVYRVVLDFGFTMVGDQFPNIDRIGNVGCPVFIFHGMEDPVIPFQHAQYLYEAVPEKFKTEPFWVEGMGHNHYSRQVGCELMRRLNEFLDFHVLARRLWMLPSSEEEDYTPRPRRLLRV
jgi:pimeloyl-ACP methyl ester carboxylesterase